MGILPLALSVLLLCEGADKKHHHKKHKHDNDAIWADKVAANTTKATEAAIMAKFRKLEKSMGVTPAKRGEILVSGPLPSNFRTVFAHSVSLATGADEGSVKIVQMTPDEGTAVRLTFEASSDVVKDVIVQASDAESELVHGDLHSFLVSSDSSVASSHVSSTQEPDDDAADAGMPYNELAPFGQEDVAQELTASSIKESEAMVDQLERAEVAEERRSVFRALTRLRGAAVSSFDSIARAHTQNIDEYAKTHQWRKTHPVHHLAEEESDVSKWAFPTNADLLQQNANDTHAMFRFA